ncbi:hypothetical protein HPP92_002362 [Vanilla planifolia]|uniref:Uncharacterized protein n=1 Tax=Vanilla planifolia TaxID=51239 RepID=A0A835S8E2_VANPL|nr:hypothetical protein HPP92_002362 [Vanilla planifolia]
MSSENDEQSSPHSPIGRSAPESFPKKQIVRYTRDFLLSFSGLDVCKKLPDGFDISFLSDLEEAAITAFERQRTGGSLSLQGSRRGEYGSQSLNRADGSIGYTRGSSGRWEVRSSGSSEREGDFQPEWESSTHDTGRRFGSQSRRTWQNPEHDGLLGSGAFARPSGYAGAQALRSRGDVQLSRSMEPYQPPRPYKAVAYSRKDSNDLCNDETFGSTESSSEDRVEEERKRRESFELMRKEQRKALLEKHNNDVHEGNMDADIIALLENSDADKCTKNRCKHDEPPASSVCQTSSSISSSNHVPVVRPLVPPGFATVQLEKNHSVRSASVDKNSVLPSKECEQGLNLPINKQKGMPASTADENDCSSAPSSVESVIACNNFSLNATALQEVHKVQEAGIQNETFPEKVEGCDTVTVVSEEHSTSILGKLFGNAMVKDSDGLANDVQNHINGADVAPWSQGASGSSKFFHLFHEEIEEKKAIEEKSSRDLLQLIVSDDNLNSQVCISSEDEVAKQMNAAQHSEDFVTPHISTGVPSDSHRSDDKQNLSCVLTCEDLEQSILAVVKESSSGIHSMQEPKTLFDGKFEEHKDNVDDHASQHLLSLLQRGVNLKETRSSPGLDAAESDEMHAFSDAEVSLGLQISDNIAMKVSEEHNSDKRLTLKHCLVRHL